MPIKTPSGDFVVQVRDGGAGMAKVAEYDANITDYDEDVDALEVTGWSVGVECVCSHFAWYHKATSEAICEACGRRIDVFVTAFSPSVKNITTDGPVATGWKVGDEVMWVNDEITIAGGETIPVLRQRPVHVDDMRERIELAEEVNRLRDHTATLMDIIAELRDRVKGAEGR